MDQALPTRGTYVCHGTTWASGDPRLLLAAVTGAPLVYAPVTGRRLGYQVSGAEPRKRSRLDEQGALIATYLARCADGRAVRFLEDALTRHLGLTQTVRAAAKLTALAELRDLAPADAAYQQHLDRATEALNGMNVPATPEPWTPPGEGDLLRTPDAGRALYPHDPRSGEHGLTVLSCLGSQILAVLGGDGEQLPYVLDLGALKGRPAHRPRRAVLLAARRRKSALF